MVRDPDHLALIRSLPCCVLRSDFPGIRTPCGGAMQAHHRVGAGLAVKAPDEEAMPLCTVHHHERHASSGAFKGWAKQKRRDWERRMVEVYKPSEEVF